MTSGLPERPADAYAWPLLPILDPDEAAEIMAERIGAAYDDLEAERLHVITSLTLGRKDLVNRFLRDFQAQLLAFSDRVRAEVAELVRAHVGPVYEQGVAAATQAPMSWTAVHTAALTSLATDTFGDFLKRSLEAGRVGAAFVRAVRRAASTEIPKIAAGGRTARQAADRLERLLVEEYGIDEITYRNGAKVTPRTYARMVTRTKSAVAYNAGTLNGSVEQGVGYVEVFDGPECGWTFHDDPDKANRSIRTVADAGRYAISHPNCRRAFGPRPDVTSEEEAAAAIPTASLAQEEDQREADGLQRATSARVRKAAARRRRLEVKRQARREGATSTDQLADIIRAARAYAEPPKPPRSGVEWYDAEYPEELKDPALLARAQDNVPALSMRREDFVGLPDELVEELMAGVPTGEERALAGWRAYTGGSYMAMNKTLRNGESHDAEARIAAFDEFFGSRFASTAPAPTVVWRGLRTFGEFDPSTVQPGQFLSDPGYLSASASESTGRSFGDWALELTLPEGTRYAPGTDYERELVLPRGSVVQITGRDPETQTLTGEVVPR